MNFPAYLLRAHIEYTTARIAPQRKRHGYGWTVAPGVAALALMGMALR